MPVIWRGEMNMGSGREALLRRTGSCFVRLLSTIKCAWTEIIVVGVVTIVGVTLVGWSCIAFFVGMGGEALLTGLLPPGAPIFGMTGLVMILIYFVLVLLVFWVYMKMIKEHLNMILNCWMAYK